MVGPSRFSGTLKLDAGDLSDYISPSNSCVVNDGGAARRNATDADPRRASGVGKAIKVTLHDCLACSGCVTSAEAVLLEQQSNEELLSKLRDEEMQVVVTVSLQSAVALADHYGMETETALRKIAGAMKGLGACAVYDTCLSKDLSLIEIAKEFMARYEQGGAFPMIASACPGWICYAEKTLGNFVLPHLSTTRSPQQIAGSFVKHFLSQKTGVNPSRLYHCTVMPCYDKKLEASRENFMVQHEGGSFCEVDCVITTGELAQLFEENGITFENQREAHLDEATDVDREERRTLFATPGGSGGFAEHIFRESSLVLFGKEIKGPLEMRTLRNQDFKEISLEVEGKVVLSVAIVYGFRNIQSIVRKMKAGKCPYHFIEIMACPRGCINGGGQLKPKEGQNVKDLITELEAHYNASITYRHPSNNSEVGILYKEWLHTDEIRRRMLHTEYQAREKSLAVQVSNW